MSIFSIKLATFKYIVVLIFEFINETMSFVHSRNIESKPVSESAMTAAAFKLYNYPIVSFIWVWFVFSSDRDLFIFRLLSLLLWLLFILLSVLFSNSTFVTIWVLFYWFCFDFEFDFIHLYAFVKAKFSSLVNFFSPSWNAV